LNARKKRKLEIQKEKRNQREKVEIQKEKRNQKEKLDGKTLTLCPEDF
jgi:hypothetical protein